MFEFGNNMHWLTSSKRLLYLRHQRFCYESLSLFLGCIVAYHRNICQIFSLLFIPPSLSLNSTNCVFINLQIIIYCSWFENYVNLYYQSHMCVLKSPPLVPINGMLIILWYGFFFTLRNLVNQYEQIQHGRMGAFIVIYPTSKRPYLSLMAVLLLSINPDYKMQWLSHVFCSETQIYWFMEVQ